MLRTYCEEEKIEPALEPQKRKTKFNRKLETHLPVLYKYETAVLRKKIDL